jgi:hypothetical protein
MKVAEALALRADLQLFEKERSSDPECQLWNICASACELADGSSNTIGGST